MYRAFFIRLIGITGLLLVLYGYYLFWISPDTEISTVIIRTRIAITVSLLGNIMVVFYLFKRQS
jgi:hypothetical protein